MIALLLSLLVGTVRYFARALRTPRSGLCLLVLLAATAPASAGDWMFRHSYYSHYDSPGFNGGPIPDPRSAYRPALVGGHPRFAIRGGFRFHSFILQNGTSSDRVFYRENWFDAGY